MNNLPEKAVFDLKVIQGNDDINRYIEELRDDTTLTRMNLMEKSLTVSAIRTKWLNYYFLEKNSLKRAKAKRDEMIKAKLGNRVQKSVLPLKNTDRISQEDENVRKIDAIMDRIKANIDFLERAMNILNDFPFSVKNSIDLLKLENM